MNWRFGDNINTDFITPGRYNLTTNADELAKIAFVEYMPGFAKQVKNGDIILAGENFGCGSSRETAAVALKACGIGAVIAKSFARIFYRNAINVGLLLIAADTDGIEDTDDLDIDLENNIIRNKTNGSEIRFQADAFMKRIHSHGGIIPYLQKNGLDSLERL